MLRTILIRYFKINATKQFDFDCDFSKSRPREVRVVTNLYLDS
jgi:hypothetical protein